MAVIVGGFGSCGKLNQIERHKKGPVHAWYKGNRARFLQEFFNDEHRPFSGLLTLHSVNGA
jgi:hypothetical protein